MNYRFLGEAWRARELDASKACDDYEGHLKPGANCLNCGVLYRLHNGLHNEYLNDSEADEVAQ